MKNLLNLEKIIAKQENMEKIIAKQENMEKIVSLFLFGYSIGLLIGEEIRESVYSEKKRKLYSGLHILIKRKLYSGLHILIKRKLELSKEKIDEIINRAFFLFRGILLCDA